MSVPSKQYAFREISASDLPMTIETFRSDTGELVDRVVIEGPCALEVKPWRQILGVPVDIVLTTPSGRYATRHDDK